MATMSCFAGSPWKKVTHHSASVMQFLGYFIFSVLRSGGSERIVGVLLLLRLYTRHSKKQGHDMEPLFDIYTMFNLLNHDDKLTLG